MGKVRTKKVKRWLAVGLVAFILIVILGFMYTNYESVNDDTENNSTQNPVSEIVEVTERISQRGARGSGNEKEESGINIGSSSVNGDFRGNSTQNPVSEIVEVVSQSMPNELKYQWNTGELDKYIQQHRYDLVAYLLDKEILSEYYIERSKYNPTTGALELHKQESAEECRNMALEELEKRYGKILERMKEDSKNHVKHNLQVKLDHCTEPMQKLLRIDPDDKKRNENCFADNSDDLSRAIKESLKEQFNEC